MKRIRIEDNISDSTEIIFTQYLKYKYIIAEIPIINIVQIVKRWI